ncbi:hypothetical protein MHBO_002563 [Bonamia ostreae]|uniref:Uncharacterized protein n=1 Tax=Bonamia ostreae TaxID=126728 RepID=A0ABV2ANJ7_9EUKA
MNSNKVKQNKKLQIFKVNDEYDDKFFGKVSNDSEDNDSEEVSQEFESNFEESQALKAKIISAETIPDFVQFTNQKCVNLNTGKKTLDIRLLGNSFDRNDQLTIESIPEYWFVSISEGKSHKENQRMTNVVAVSILQFEVLPDCCEKNIKDYQHIEIIGGGSNGAVFKGQNLKLKHLSFI